MKWKRRRKKWNRKRKENKVNEMDENKISEREDTGKKAKQRNEKRNQK